MKERRKNGKRFCDKKERERKKRKEDKECNEMRNEIVRQRKLGRKKNKYRRKKEEKEGIV